MKRFLLVALGCLALIVIVVVVQRGEDKTQPEGPVEPPAEVRPTPAAPAISPEEEKARQEVARIALGIKPDLATPKLIELLEKLGVLEQDFQTPEGKKLLADARARIAELHNERFNALIGRSKALADEWKFEEAKKVLVDARSGDFATFATEIDGELAQLTERKRLTAIYPGPQTPRFLQGVRDEDFEPLRLTDDMLDEKRGYDIDYHNYRPVLLEAGTYMLRLLYSNAVELACNGVTIVSHLRSFTWFKNAEDAQRDWVLKELTGRVQRTVGGWRLTIDEFWEGKKVKTSIYELSRTGLTASFSVDFADRPWTGVGAHAEVATDGLGPLESLELSGDGRPFPGLDPTRRQSDPVRRDGKRLSVAGEAGYVSLVRTKGNNSGLQSMFEGGAPLVYILSMDTKRSGGQGYVGGGSVRISARIKEPLPVQRKVAEMLPEISSFIEGLSALRRFEHSRDLVGPWQAEDFTIDNAGVIWWKGEGIAWASEWKDLQLKGVEHLEDGVSLEFESKNPERKILRRIFATITPQCALYSVVTEAGPYHDWKGDFWKRDLAPGDITGGETLLDSCGLHIVMRSFEDASTLYSHAYGNLLEVRAVPVAYQLAANNQLLFMGPSRRLAVVTRFRSNLGTMLSESPIGMHISPKTGSPDVSIRCSSVDTMNSIAGIPIRTCADILIVPQEGVGTIEE